MMYVYTHDLALLKIKSELQISISKRNWSISFKDKFSNEDIMAAMLGSTPKTDLKAYTEEDKYCFLKERHEIKQSIIFL